MCSTKVLKALLLILMFVNVEIAWADKRLQIEADRVEYDQAGKLSQYTGNVRVIAARLELMADNIRVTHLEKSITTIQAWGAPAVFKRTLLSNRVNRASAKEIVYDVSQQQVFFVGEVEAEYDGSSLRGERLRYELVTDRMRVEGSGIGAPVRIEIDAETAP
ncbi:MAG: lipopolysaccharide transport periplasmic protein LptA [Gammaproteobacteria bacterium]|nr:lipopolysaccharide transport periplasmic protein LptA [Gammaproteobacteria bacterium]